MVLEEHLLQAGLVHLLDVVIEQLLPLGEHLVVEHVPESSSFMQASPDIFLSPFPSLLGWQISSWQVLMVLNSC